MCLSLFASSACLAGRHNVYGLWFIRLCPFFAVIIFAFTVKSLQLESSGYYLKEGNIRTHLTRELLSILSEIGRSLEFLYSQDYAGIILKENANPDLSKALP